MLACLLVTPAAAQSAIDFAHLRPAKDSFVVMRRGKLIGFEVITLEKTADGFLVKDDTNLMPRRRQNTEVTMGGTGAMTSVKQRSTRVTK